MSNALRNTNRAGLSWAMLALLTTAIPPACIPQGGDSDNNKTPGVLAPAVVEPDAALEEPAPPPGESTAANASPPTANPTPPAASAARVTVTMPAEGPAKVELIKAPATQPTASADPAPAAKPASPPTNTATPEFRIRLAPLDAPTTQPANTATAPAAPTPVVVVAAVPTPPRAPKPECLKDSDCQAGGRQFVCLPGVTTSKNACGDPCEYLPHEPNDPAEAGCVYAARMTNNTRNGVREGLLKMKGHAQRQAEGRSVAKRQGNATWTYTPDRIPFPADSTPADRKRIVLGGTKGGVRSDPMNPGLVVMVMKRDVDGFELVGVAEKAARRAVYGVREDLPDVVDDALEVSTRSGEKLDRFVGRKIGEHERGKVHAEPAPLDDEPAAPSATRPGNPPPTAEQPKSGFVPAAPPEK